MTNEITEDDSCLDHEISGMKKVLALYKRSKVSKRRKILRIRTNLTYMTVYDITRKILQITSENPKIVPRYRFPMP